MHIFIVFIQFPINVYHVEEDDSPSNWWRNGNSANLKWHSLIRDDSHVDEYRNPEHNPVKRGHGVVGARLLPLIRCNSESVLATQTGAHPTETYQLLRSNRNCISRALFYQKRFLQRIKHWLSKRTKQDNVRRVRSFYFFVYTYSNIYEIRHVFWMRYLLSPDQILNVKQNVLCQQEQSELWKLIKLSFSQNQLLSPQFCSNFLMQTTKIEK